MERLKHETRAEHLALEARVPLMQPGLTVPQYAQVLRAFASVVLPLEQRLAALPLPDALKYPARRHTPALQADLAALGLDWSPHPLPETLATSLPAAYGTLYVLEGSTLGGQLISRHLKKHLNLDGTSGAAYFSGYGPDTGRQWRAFTQFMRDAEREAAQPGWADAMVQDMVQEARAAFAVFAAALLAVAPAPRGAA